MKVKLTKGRVAIAAVVAASFTLVSGCSSDKGGDSDSAYSNSGYSTSTTSTTQTSKMSATGGTNAVIPLYKESLAISKREVDDGSVRVKKVVKTETVNQPVELRHEEIVIERTPASETASNPSGSASAFQEGETVIRLTREEPVVEKQTTSSGQIVLQSRTASTQTNIQGQVRSEDVAVVKSGNTENVTVGQNIQESGEAVGAAESPAGQATGESTGGTITNPSMLSNGGSGSIGRTVQFSNIKILSITGDDVVRLDDGYGQSIYVYCSKGAGGLKTGDSVNLKGIVRTGAGELSGTTAQILSSQSAYIDAQKIETIGMRK